MHCIQCNAQRLSDVISQRPGAMDEMIHNPYAYVADCLIGMRYDQSKAVELLTIIDSYAKPQQRKKGLQSLVAKDRGYDTLKISVWTLGKLDTIPSKLEKTVLFHAWKSPDAFEFHQIGAWRDQKKYQKPPNCCQSIIYTCPSGRAASCARYARAICGRRHRSYSYEGGMRRGNDAALSGPGNGAWI